MTELRLIAKDAACLSEATCPAILTDGERAYVVGAPSVLPDDAPSSVGLAEVVVAIPAALLDQAVQVELNRLAHEAAHWQDTRDLRDHHAEPQERRRL